MYFIQVIRGEVYIRKPNKDFDLYEFLEGDNYLEVDILRNQFIDRSLLLIYNPECNWTDDEFVTKDGQVINGGFTIVGNSVDDKKYTLLTAFQVEKVIRELL